MKRSLLLLAFALLPVSQTSSARAEDSKPETVYVRVPFSALPDGHWLNMGWGSATVLSRTPGFRVNGRDELWFAAKPGVPITGTIAWEDGVWKHLRFTIKDSSAHAVDKKAYDRALAAHYEDLTNRGVAGAALFRARRIALGVGQEADARNPWRRNLSRNRGRGSRFDLFTGGRAFTENLQLDRELPGAKPMEATVPIDSIKGITVQAYEWKLPEQAVPVDRLAAFVPEDQYAVFFASPAAFRTTLDLIRDEGTPLLRWMEPRAEDGLVLERYQRQLALDLSALPGKTVALTGSDPFFADGTDVALILEGVSVRDLPSPAGVRAVKGTASGTPWHGFVSGHRTVSSFRADVGGAAVVSNSRVQLEAILAVAAKTSPSLAALDEYVFFRARYTAGEDDAFLMIPDGAIRKWCSPKWRIAAGRRRTALSEILDRQVRIADRTATEPEAAKTVDLALRLDGEDVVSDVYGTRDFLTPIAELELDKVTPEESRFYETWRNGYESNWSNFFDPIAASLKTANGGVDLDVSVMPLIDNSDYDEYIDVARGVSIGADAGDRHPESLVHMTFAINADSKAVKDAWQFVSSATRIRVNPMGWLGTSWSLYVDTDPFFEEMARAEDPEEFLEQNWYRFPGALQCEVKDSAKLVVFLVGARRFIEHAVPGMTEWSVGEHAGKKYTIIRVKGPAEWNLDKLRLYYAVAENGLTLTINESVMKRALERAAAMEAAKEKENGEESRPERTKRTAEPRRSANARRRDGDVPWLGQHLALHGKRAVADMFDKLAGRQSFQASMRRHCYRNLHVLNEWKRRYPDADPVAVHERVFGTRLLCPGGGRYVWNDKAHTMESTVFGHPAAPKEADLQPAYRKWSLLNAGATFEENGLRARLQLTRAK